MYFDNKPIQGNPPTERTVPANEVDTTLGEQSLNGLSQDLGRSIDISAAPSPTKFPTASSLANLQKEIENIENNIFTRTDLSLEEASARRKLITGGVLSAIFSGGLAMAGSTVVSIAALPVIKAVGGATIAVCAICGAVGGAGMGAWFAVEFAKEISEKHPGVAGTTLAVAFIAAGVPLGMATGALAGILGLGSVGLSATFLMAQGVGFGAFKASLIILEPLAKYTIGAGFNKWADQDLDKSPGEKQHDLTDLKTFCNTPLSYSAGYWYDTIFSPPIHPDIQKLGVMHYVEWDARKEEKTAEDGASRGSAAEESALGTVAKIGKMVKHAAQTALHRATNQIFRKTVNAEAGISLFSEIKNIATEGKFTNSAQAWENFEQVDRRFGRTKNVDLNKAKNEAKDAITANYGPKPSTIEVLTCGLYRGGRLQDLNLLLRDDKDKPIDRSTEL